MATATEKLVPETSHPGPAAVTKKMKHIFAAAKIYNFDGDDISQFHEAVEEMAHMRSQNDHFTRNVADFSVTPIGLWLAYPDLFGRLHGLSAITMNSAFIQHAVSDFILRKDIQDDVCSTNSVQICATPGHFKESAEAESWSSSSTIISAEINDLKARFENDATAVSPKIQRAVKETTAPLDSVTKLAVRTVDAAAQSASGSFSQLQYDLTFGTGVTAILTAVASYVANGYAALKTASAAMRSAVANERVAAVQEASLQWQKQEAARKKDKSKSQDDTDESDESDDEGGDAPHSPLRSLVDPTRSSASRQSLEVEARSSMAIGHLKDKKETAANSIKFPSVPTSILFPDFPSVPTSPWTGEIQSNDDESKIQDAQQQREAANKPSISEAVTKTTNVQRFEGNCQLENDLSAKLQQRRQESEKGRRGVTRSLSITNSRNSPSVSLTDIDTTQKKFKEQNIVHELLRSVSITEDVSCQSPIVPPLSVGLSTLSDDSSSMELPAWDMKAKDLPLKQFSDTSRKEITWSNGSVQEKLLLPRESNIGLKDVSANKGSDERLEQAEACKDIERTAIQDFFANEELYLPPTSTEASEEDGDISATE